MRRFIRSASLALACAAAACGYGYEMRSTEIAGTTTVTSGPAAGERELSRSVSSVSDRIAGEVCKRELACGRGEGAEFTACMDTNRARAARELRSWSCDPASIRARAEQCLAGLDELTCERELTAGRRLCPAVDTCGPHEAALVSPGPALGGVWRR